MNKVVKIIMVAMIAIHINYSYLMGGKDYFLCKYSVPGVTATVAVDSSAGGSKIWRQDKTIRINSLEGLLGKWREKWHHSCTIQRCNSEAVHRAIKSLFRQQVEMQFLGSEMPKNINQIVEFLWEKARDGVAVKCHSLKKGTKAYSQEKMRELYPSVPLVD